MDTTKFPALGDIFWMLDGAEIVEATIIAIYNERFDPDIGLIIAVDGDVDDSEHEIVWDERHATWKDVGINLEDWEEDDE